MIVGTAGSKTIRGMRRRDVIAALGGNDVGRSFGGKDVVCGQRPRHVQAVETSQPPSGWLAFSQCATVAHMSDRVGVRQLRQNLSRYLNEVKSGSTLVVTERGREVARLVPSGVGDSVLGRLAAERGATLPTGSLVDVKPRRRAKGKPSGEVLDELRGERL